MKIELLKRFPDAIFTTYYDEVDHDGVCIVRFTDSSGKSRVFLGFCDSLDAKKAMQGAENDAAGMALDQLD